MFVRPQCRGVLRRKQPTAAVILDRGRNDHLPRFVVNDLLNANSFVPAAARLKVLARVGAYGVVEAAERAQRVQERGVRLVAGPALLNLGLLLAAVRAAHAVVMRVEAFTARFALRRALMD